MAVLDLKNIEPNILRKTLDLVELYNKNSRFRETFDKNLPNKWATFRGLPLKTYIKVLTTTTRYKRYFNEIKKNSEATKELFFNFYKDPSGYAKLHRDFTLNQFTSGLTKEELALAKQIEEVPQKSEGHKKLVSRLHDKSTGQSLTSSIKKILGQKEEEGQITELEDVVKETVTPTQTPSQIESAEVPVLRGSPGFQMPSFVKNLASGAKILARKLIVKFAPNIFSGTIGGLVGSALFGVRGSLVGAGIGLVFPNALKNSVLRGFLGASTKAVVGTGTKAAGAAAVRSGLLAAGAGGGPVGWVATIGVTLATSKTVRNVVIGIIGGLFILPLILGLNKQLAFFPPPGAVETAVLPPGYLPPGSSEPSSDISSCQFVRSDHSPKGASYQSTQLLAYFQEASNLTGIPPALLAAFMRVESPGLTSYPDEALSRYQCAESPTGALGVMQIQPAGTVGHSPGGVAQGAKLLGLTYNNLTRADFCDIRTSIIMGAGFMLYKMGVTSWDPAWTGDKQMIDKLVTGYYGCLNYGGGDPTKCTGPYNYGDDVWESIQNCKPAAPLPPSSATISSCPIPGGVATCGSLNTSRASCSHCGAGYEPYTTAFCPPPWGKAGYDGTQYALDIGGTSGQEFFLPTIDGRVIQWTYISELGGTNGQIQKYIGKNAIGDSYLLYFHHTQSGSGNGKSGISGDLAGQICLGCNIGNTHLHVQLADGSGSWLDSAQYFCK
ncbi:hypothetical protein A2617_01835 [Candidatus Daviesbacteria bacterium RIFOXYD1_FULL_41_10]|uniref:Transglycosylase SLT domain-containing protein n=2 Tax=Candidatus Daviesiibacteriota TaxID=1752718 RepID=A0A1F5MZL9_9BACT|nr:MAG: hypothetical protein A2617_01835 [Candidatus Daviesbacteria bacterium RIFOXYD1_FULL_41_10]